MSSNTASKKIIEEVKMYAIKRKNEIIARYCLLFLLYVRKTQISQEMMGYNSMVQNLPPNAPDKKMWLLLAKNCFEIVKSAESCLKSIDSIIKQLDSVGDALSMMELKNILLSLRPEY